MTSHPFQPNDESDNLNTILDAMVTGKRAPEAGSASGSDPLVATARLINGTYAKPGEFPSDDTLDSIWRNVMQSPSQAISAQEPLSSFSPNGTKNRIANVPPSTGSSRFASWFAITAMAALLIGLVGGAWGVRQSGGDDNPIRLAATVLDQTPEADAVDLRSAIKAEDCTQKPMSSDEYIRILENEDGWPIPIYGPVSQPTDEDANSAAMAARSYIACIQFGSHIGIFASEPYLWRTKSPNSPISGLTAGQAHQIDAGRDVSRYLSDLDPEDLFINSASPESDDVEPMISGIVLTGTAVQFQDGRIGLPMSGLVPKGIEYQVSNPYYTGMFVFNKDSGAWKIDDVLTICVGDCSDFLNGGPWKGSEITGIPDTTMDWLTWARPEECTAEPMTTEEYGDIMREEPDISGRAYEVVGPADPETARAVTAAARAHEACKIYGSTFEQRSLETPANIFYRSATDNRTLSPADVQALDSMHGLLLSETMPAKEPGTYAKILTETPPDELIGYMRTQGGASQSPVFLSLAYDPANAVELEDGRVSIPATILYWSGGDPDEWYQVEQWQIDESTSLFTFIMILDNQDGTWKVDEQLGFCPFEDCDQVWDQATSAAPREPNNGLLPLPGTPIASPVETPEG